MNGVATQGGGDVGFASQADHADGQVTQGGHDLRSGAGAHLGSVQAGRVRVCATRQSRCAPGIGLHRRWRPVPSARGSRCPSVLAIKRGAFGDWLRQAAGWLRRRPVRVGFCPGCGRCVPVGIPGPGGASRCTCQQVGNPQPSLFDATAVLVNLRRLGRFQFPVPDGGDVLQPGRCAHLSVIHLLNAGWMREIASLFEYGYPGWMGCSGEKEPIVCSPPFDQVKYALDAVETVGCELRCGEALLGRPAGGMGIGWSFRWTPTLITHPSGSGWTRRRTTCTGNREHLA